MFDMPLILEITGRTLARECLVGPDHEQCSGPSRMPGRRPGLGRRRRVGASPPGEAAKEGIA